MRHRTRHRLSWSVTSIIAAFALAGCADPATAPSGETLTPPPDNLAPSAVFSTSCLLLDCNFNASASSDADGIVDAQDWEFGDGATDSGTSPAHSYSADGDYTIVLTVTDNDGATSASSQTVTVATAGNSNNPPSASFDSICTDLACNFDASTSFDSDGTIAAYDWDYGDTGSGSGQTSGHDYGTDGVYGVELIVTDNAGAMSSSSQQLTVSGAGGVADGASLYVQKCATCHGADALGGTLAKISIVGKTAQQITDAIMSVPNMSSLGSLTADEIQAIADYLATL